MIFHDSTQKRFFSKHKNKAEFKCLDDSEVLSSGFPGLKTYAASMTSVASTASMASMTSTASFHQKNTDPDDLIIPSTQMTNTSPFLWNGSSKIQFFTDIWYSSWRGCWGQLMSFFWKLVDETQMCNPPEATRHHNLIKLLILLPLRAIYLSLIHIWRCRRRG